MANCLSKDRDTLLTFFDFAAGHWKHCGRAMTRERLLQGDRRLQVLLKGRASKLKGAVRLRREERLPVCCRGGRKRVIETRAPMIVLTAP